MKSEVQSEDLTGEVKILNRISQIVTLLRKILII